MCYDVFGLKKKFRKKLDTHGAFVLERNLPYPNADKITKQRGVQGKYPHLNKRSMLEESKNDSIKMFQEYANNGLLEEQNVKLITKLINNATSEEEVLAISALGTNYKRTGLHFDKRLEKMGLDIKFFKRNNKLSFSQDDTKKAHKLIIGDNYDALLNLLITHKKSINVIYIDPPYGKDHMGAFAKTNYDNCITRDNLLSMLYPRLMLAKQLLAPQGVILISIDDRNQAYIQCLMNEIFGESNFLFNIPRLTKKGGKTTPTIQKNHDYILAYGLETSQIVFSQDEKDLSSFNKQDEYVNERGPYNLKQTLDYNSLQYSRSLDYPFEYAGKVYYPGSSKEEWEKRQAGQHAKADWAWRWTRDALEWGIKNGFIVFCGERIYTKTYLYCRKATGKNEIEKLEGKKAYTTLSYTSNEFSNDIAKKELDAIFSDGDNLFSNPKPSKLISQLIRMVCEDPNAIILDFFAGSGTTGHAVLELNKEDRQNNINANRQFILVTDNHKEDGEIAYSVTSKRLKRIMTGKCYDENADFKWSKQNDPYGGNLEVLEIDSVSSCEKEPGKTAFDVIDEKLYEQRFSNIQEKISWVCKNFAKTRKLIDSIQTTNLE